MSSIVGSSSAESSYTPPGHQQAKEKQLELDKESLKETLLQQLSKVFHEPDIPLKDKVILGPIEKYIKYSKNPLSNLLPFRPIPLEAYDPLAAYSLYFNASAAHSPRAK